MAKLAIKGGKPVRRKDFPTWPIVDQKDEEAILAALRSKHWGLGGRFIPAFEEKFAKWHHAKHCVAVVNGTAALEVALKAVGVKAGDEVIVPPYTFIATAAAVLMVNAIPVFVDIEPESYLLDPAKVEAAITKRTAAIIPVHIAGCPCDMDKIMRIARKHKIAVIEDAAQAHGAEWKGRRVGAIGDAGTFSFQSSKNLSSGEGGACVTDDRQTAERMWSLHNCGRAPQGAFYEHRTLGWNYRMTEFQAALLLSQMRRLESQMKKRDENGAYLSRLLDEIPGVGYQRMPKGVTRHAYHLYILRYDSRAFKGLPRQEFIRALNAEGIGCSAGYVPLYREQLFVVDQTAHLLGRKVDYSKVRLPVCERVCAQESIWLYQRLLLGTKRDMEDIAEAISKIQKYVDELMC